MESAPLPTTPRSFFSRLGSPCMQARTPEERRAIARSRRVTSTALVVMIVFSELVENMKVGPARTVIAVFAALSFCTIVFSSGELVWRTSDEFRRLLLTKSFFAASVLTFLFATLWGYAELFSRGTFPHLPLLVLPVMLIFLTTAAKVIIFRQHRVPRD